MKSLKIMTVTIRHGICLLFFAMMLVPAYSQNGDPAWKKDLEASLQKFVECTETAGEKYECSSFIGEAMSKVYKTDAFYSKKLNRYLRINEISRSMVETGWTQLGPAYEQNALEQAQKQANANKAVIAVYTTSNGIAHIAVILPGKLQYSGSWGFHVPNAASFVFNDSEKSFIDKGLSYAFTKSMIKDVVLYARK